MADSDSGGLGSSSPWWKSLMNSRKKSKEAAGGAQPAAQPAPGESQSSEPLNPDCTSSSQENLHPILSEDAGEPHKLDKSYGEKAGNSRRNLKISRSGRFKEKRKVRVTLLPGGVVSSEETEATCDPHEEKQ